MGVYVVTWLIKNILVPCGRQNNLQISWGFQTMNRNQLWNINKFWLLLCPASIFYYELPILLFLVGETKKQHFISQLLHLLELVDTRGEENMLAVLSVNWDGCWIVGLLLRTESVTMSTALEIATMDVGRAPAGSWNIPVCGICWIISFSFRASEIDDGWSCEGHSGFVIYKILWTHTDYESNAKRHVETWNTYISSLSYASAH